MRYLILLLVGCSSLPAPGVPRELAESRAKIRDIRYELSFTIRPSEPVRGTATVRFVLEKSGDVILDFRGRLTSGQRHENGHILLPLAAGEHAVKFEFESQDRPLNRHPEYLYTLFVPARASEVFPCFDQPDLKARFSLSLDVPEGWTWVWNGTNEPISTYLFAFAAGKFQVETSGSMRMFHRETDREKVERNRAAIFELHERALKWLEEYTGIPYPFGKFDFVLLPAFQYNGMEHPGAIFYRSAALFLEKTATQEQELDRANVISHETAHMWFGDLVTMRWFDDVWMKEVFANFLAAKIVNPSFPKMNHELRFLMAHYPAAYAVDRSAGTHPIRRPLDNLLNAGSLYGAIIYKKAPIVLQQLERSLGEETFREGVREYLRRHRFGNAGWPDLVAIWKCEDWSRRWIETAGMPVNGDTLYGFVERDVRDPSTLADPFERGVEWIHAYESLVRGRMTADAFLDLALKGLPIETEDLIVNRVLAYLDRAYWIFSDRSRSIDLWPLFEKAQTRSLKAAYFAGYRSLIRTPDLLREIWAGKEIGLPLSEADYMALALDLRVRGVDVLEKQLARIQDPDRRARFRFVKRAFDDGFFESLKDPKNRAQEPWVIEALSYLHHPLRAPETESLILPALEMMEEVRQTGDVFFPERWAHAVLSGHSTKTAGVFVRAYLAGDRGDPRLREKVLQAADLLLRVSSTRP